MTLALYRADLVGRATQLAQLPPEELRRRAVAAARDRDVGALWDITEAHLTTYGRAGGRVSAPTLRTYRAAVRDFIAWTDTQAESVLRPRRDAGALYLRHLEGAGHTPSTVRVKLAGARSLYRALRWAGATETDPFQDARPAPDPTPPWEKRQPYEEVAAAALLEAADPRMRALLLLCGHAGLRIGEALALTWADLDLAGSALIVRRGKGNKSRRVTMSSSLASALRALPHETGAVIGRTPEAARKRLRSTCRRAGVSYLGFHALRHYAGTRLVRQTGSLEHAARHLGHSSIETTRIYAKWSDRELSRALSSW